MRRFIVEGVPVRAGRELGAMLVDDDEDYYTRRAQQELERAALALDLSAKRVHLDLAAKYATLRERSHAPHKPD